MAPKARAADAVESQEVEKEQDEETPDIIPDRTLTAEEAEQDYQMQLTLLAEQEAEFNARGSGDSVLENGEAVEKNTAR